jgi:membrane protease YdiL (CAAX protease family)
VKEKRMGVRIKFQPIAEMLAVIVVVILLIVLIFLGFMSLPDYEILMNESGWILAGLVHIPQFLIPFLLIYYISKGNLKEYGFNLREVSHFTHKRMLVIGILFGLLFSLRYTVQIITGAPLDIPYPVTLLNVVGNMVFQWIIVGVCEETMFRGLIQTYLMKGIKGNVEIVGREFHIGTIIAAVFWGGFHFINMLVGMPLDTAFLLVLVTTAMGLLMGYAYQRTGSLLTTIIVHNTIFGVPTLIGYILYSLV